MTADAMLPLVLGTVQLGMPYGIANRTGRPDEAAATAIVRAAWDGGVREFDTAQDYGESEAVLGRALARLGVAGQAAVVTKMDPALDPRDGDAMVRAVEASLRRLGVGRLEAVLLHREELLDRWWDGLDRAAARMVREGLARRFGVSVYSPARAAAALRTDGLDVVQVPANLLDGRFEDAGVFDLAAAAGKRIYVRSVFLQGLVLMRPDAVPPGLEEARPVLERLEALARREGLRRQELALAAVRPLAPRARILFGAETPEQVRANLAAWARPAPPDLRQRVRAAVGRVDERILNPALWPKPAPRTLGAPAAAGPPASEANR